MKPERRWDMCVSRWCRLVCSEETLSARFSAQVDWGILYTWYHVRRNALLRWRLRNNAYPCIIKGKKCYIVFNPLNNFVSRTRLMEIVLSFLWGDSEKMLSFWKVHPTLAKNRQLLKSTIETWDIKPEASRQRGASTSRQPFVKFSAGIQESALKATLQQHVAMPCDNVQRSKDQ